MSLKPPANPAARAALLSVALSAVLMTVKITAGIVTGSAAVLSDGIDSFEDLIAASIVFVSIRIGARPPDAGHPYGHGRVETIAATLQGVFLAVGGLFILYTAAGRFADQPEEIDTTLALAVMLGTAAANLALVQYTSRVARRTGSPALQSEVRHLWANVVQALGVVAALALVAVTGEFAFDAAIAMLLGLYLLWSAGRIIWASGSDVMDASLEDEEVERVGQLIREAGGARVSFHQLRSRRSGQVRHIDFHLVVPGELTVHEAHDIAIRIDRNIGATWPGSVVTVHTEPEGSECDAEPGL